MQEHSDCMRPKIMYPVTISAILEIAAVMVFNRDTNTTLLILFATAQCDGLHSRAVLVVRGDEARFCKTQRSTRHQRR